MADAPHRRIVCDNGVRNVGDVAIGTRERNDGDAEEFGFASGGIFFFRVYDKKRGGEGFLPHKPSKKRF